MKYENEFKKSSTKGEFIKRVLRNYPEIKSQSAERRYYDLKRFFQTSKRPTQQEVIATPLIPITKNIEYDKNETKPLDIYKDLMIQDMLRYNIKLTRAYLKKHGFMDSEINWLIQNDKINLTEDY